MNRLLAILTAGMWLISSEAQSISVLTAPDAATIAKKKVSAGGGGGGSPLITSGLILYYKLDDGSGTTASDASGNSHAGTLSGAGLPTWVSGYIGANAVNFASGNGYIDSNTDAACNMGSGDFTMVCWTKLTGSSTYMVMGKNSGSGNEYGLYVSSGAVFCRANGATCNSGATTINDGNWHHIAATYISGTITLYVDGSSKATVSYTGPCNPSGNFRVGVWGTGGGFFYAGTIDEVGLYSRGLSGAEMTTLFGQTHP